MNLNPYLETEDKFINNIKKKSTNNKLSLFEVINITLIILKTRVRVSLLKRLLIILQLLLKEILK